MINWIFEHDAYEPKDMLQICNEAFTQNNEEHNENKQSEVKEDECL